MRLGLFIVFSILVIVGLLIVYGMWAVRLTSPLTGSGGDV